MRVAALQPTDFHETVTVMAVIDFHPWPFHEGRIDCKPSQVGTISSNATVTWAAHRAFNLLTEDAWNKLVVFSDGRCATGHRDHKFLNVGTELVVRGA